MFKKIVLGFVASLAFSSMAFANPDVYGDWLAVKQLDDGKVSMILSITANDSSLNAVCESDNKIVSVTATVPSEVTSSQIILKGSASDSKSNGSFSCSVKLVPMAFDYILDGDSLTLISEDHNVELKRIK